jgi:hypothetical protein
MASLFDQGNTNIAKKPEAEPLAVKVANAPNNSGVNVSFMSHNNFGV